MSFSIPPLASAFVLSLLVSSGRSAELSAPSDHRILEVTVTNTAGKPVAGADVDLIGLDRGGLHNDLQPDDRMQPPPPPALSPWHHRTDDRGRVTIKLGSFSGYDLEDEPGWGIYHLVARAPGKDTAISDRLLHAAENPEPKPPGKPSTGARWPGKWQFLDKPATAISLRLERGVSLTGKVIDTEGKPLPNRKIAAWIDLGARTPTGHGGRILAQTTTTDPAGGFLIDGIPAVPFLFDVIGGDGFWIGTKIREVAKDEIIDQVTPGAGETKIPVQLVLSGKPPYRYHGIVTDAGGKPLAGAKIVLAPSLHRDDRTWGDNHRFEELTSDAEGRYEYHSATRFIRFISAEAEGFFGGSEEPEEDHVAPGEHSFHLRAAPREK